MPKGFGPALALKAARGILRRTKVRVGNRTVEEFELAGDAARGDADRKAADAGLQPEFDLAWTRPSFSHRRWVGSTTKSASAVRRVGGASGGTHARASVGCRRFFLGRNLRSNLRRGARGSAPEPAYARTKELRDVRINPFVLSN
jgi:hypothetical protein